MLSRYYRSEWKLKKLNTRNKHERVNFEANFGWESQRARDSLLKNFR